MFEQFKNSGRTEAIRKFVNHTILHRSTETEINQVHEELKGVYDGLLPVLAKADIIPHKNSYNSRNGTYIFIGVPGIFPGVYVFERSWQFKNGFINLEQVISDSKCTYHRKYWLHDDGRATIEIDVDRHPEKYHSRERFTATPPPKDSILRSKLRPSFVLREWKNLADLLTRSIENPNNTHQETKRRLKEFYPMLMNYFADRGIVPATRTVVFNGFSEEDFKLIGAEQIMPGLSKSIKETEPAILEKGVTYRDISIPGTEGIWDVTFDIDVGNDIDRAFAPMFENRRRSIETHGLGIILNHRLPEHTEVFQLWKNGDGDVFDKEIRGQIDETISGNRVWVTHNPHFVKIKFDELMNQIQAASEKSV